jgi:hypothetical protein
VRKLTTAPENLGVLSIVLISRSDAIPYRVQFPRKLFLFPARFSQLVQHLSHQLLLSCRSLGNPLQSLIAVGGQLTRPLEAFSVLIAENTDSERKSLIGSSSRKSDLVNELREELHQTVCEERYPDSAQWVVGAPG